MKPLRRHDNPNITLEANQENQNRQVGGGNVDNLSKDDNATDDDNCKLSFDKVML